MHLGAKPLFSATDLTSFLACRHLTAVERLAASGMVRRPFNNDPMLEILRERGLAHELKYVERLRQEGRNVVEIVRGGGGPFKATLSAMSAGADAIVQARLEHQVWAGWSDVLLRVDGKSKFGPWRYEPVETKLAKETKGTTLLQLCFYAELVASIQEADPAELRVVVAEANFVPERYRFDEFRSYFRFVRRGFESVLATPLPVSVAKATPYPEPVPQCDVCNWWATCAKRRTDDDHLSLVAGISKTQRKELTGWGVPTLEALAKVPLPITQKPSRGSIAALERVREQARVQLEARKSGKPVYELLPIEEEFGLAGLPPPSQSDVFLDLEGDRLAENGGFEYLFGFALHGDDGKFRYEGLWATTPSGERQVFERFIDLVVERRTRDPSMHVFHYAPYEPTAMKRLMGRYATRADELDRLLREKVFVDLYSVVRRGVRAGVDSYSIKRLEQFYGLVRDVDLRLASRHLRAVEYAIAKHDAGAITAASRAAVESYNRDDCLSALALRDWLETLRLEAEKKNGAAPPRPKPVEVVVSEKLSDHLAKIRAVSSALTTGLPEERTPTQQAQWILAQLLEWHRREDKVDWWELFRLNAMTDDELLDERAGLAGLEFQKRVFEKKLGGVVDRYSFPAQDTEFEEGDAGYEPRAEKPSHAAYVQAIDFEKRTVDLIKTKTRRDEHPTAMFKKDILPNPEAVNALLRLGEFVRDHGIDGPGAHRAERDLLLRLNPRLAGGVALRLPGEAPTASARRAALALDGGLLAIQGPPGAGKTFTGARMIVDLVRQGKRIGVTAVGHKVIRNLLKEVVQAAEEEKVSLRCMHRVSEEAEVPDKGIEEELVAGAAFKKILEGEFNVVGGTAWVWSSSKITGAIDVLFVDEAGQMSLADVLACSQSAKNVVLLGDPQQLEQPQQASHPEGSELSALEYLLEGHDTMPLSRGLFLGETWRLHPAICSFTSDMFYEGKLLPVAGLEGQLIAGITKYAGAGLFYEPIEHVGNQNSSPEEADAVAAIVADLLQAGVTWTNAKGQTKALKLGDILIVAPYNAQVSKISERIPGAHVGTVDKFQGQEAPVVIYSMATSDSADAPHGMDFLFNRNRLNVATSRARCVCIMVANPKLFELDCRTPDQMRMANAFCAYLERAKTL